MAEIDDSAVPTVEVLWRRHAAELLRFATVLVGPSDAQDIVVEAVLSSEARIAGGSVGAPRAYLFRAVTNRANDLRRARGRRWHRDLAAVGPADTAAPDTFIDVRRAVARLSVTQRAVIHLAYWEDLAEREIAELLDLAPSTVHAHLTSARDHLRKAL